MCLELIREEEIECYENRDDLPPPDLPSGGVPPPPGMKTTYFSGIPLYLSIKTTSPTPEFPPTMIPLNSLCFVPKRVYTYIDNMYR